ncbi:MAG TPA: DUF1778 domain-containing protein [Candidatus Obscuribacterales bacterium]
MAQKEIRLNLRATPEQRELIEKAAAIKRTSLTSFILDVACEAAEELLIQQRHFELSPEKWEAFCAALDAPPREIPALKRLFDKPSVFGDSKDSHPGETKSA